jgi:23S rRNA (pseudouridine1915-N3)-methyltransferase
MHSIQVLAFGRPKLEPVRDLEQHYLTLLRPFAKMAVVELSEAKGDPARQLQDEATKLRPKLQSARSAVLLDAGGPVMTSEAFSAWVGIRLDRGESLCFALGSSHGFDPALKTEFPGKLSLSPMTFPHDLARVLLLEQLYRAFQILRGGPYHK